MPQPAQVDASMTLTTLKIVTGRIPKAWRQLPENVKAARGALGRRSERDRPERSMS